MALPLQVDWNKVQSMYLKGMTPKQIGELLGIKADSVSARAFRYKWRKSLLDSSVIVKAHNDAIQGNEPETPESSHLTKASASVKGSLANALLQATGCLDTLPQSKSLKSRTASAQLLSTLAGVGKTVFGWSEGQSTPSVRINVMANCTLSPPDQAKAIEQAPVIDVTPVLNNPPVQASDAEELKPPSEPPKGTS